MTDLAPADSKRIAEIIEAHRATEGAALPILHAIQSALGYVPEAAVPVIAEALNITRAEMHGVVTFYHDFRNAPPGRHVLKLCRAEACQSMGGDALADHARARTGLGWGETSRDQRLTLEPIFCLGLCACAPAAMMDGRVVGRLDNAGIDALLAEAQR